MSLEGILGDYRRFFATQRLRLAELNISVDDRPAGHLAFRVGSHAQYRSVRDRLESEAVANVENEWNGRPISKILLRQPLKLSEQHNCDLIELIPPPHQQDYPMGLEHLGFVLGDYFDRFASEHRLKFTGQQDQGPFNQPLLITFDDGTSVKFHRHSLADVVVMEGRLFDGFHHLDASG